jgi:hypothetical protein
VRKSLLAAALLACAPAIHAQDADPIIKRIWSLGMDSSQTPRLAQVFLDSLGPRLLGSPNLRNSQEWVMSNYKAWGIEAKAEKFGTWRSWRRGYSHIDLVAPRMRTLEGTMLGFSPGTKKKDKTADVIVLPRFADSTEFVKWLPQAKGKFVLVSAPLPSCRPTEDWTKNATPAVAARGDSARAAAQREWGGRNVRGTGYSLALGGGELAVRLEEGGAAGVISSRPKNGRGAMEIFETYTTKVPTVGLSCEDYGLVFRLADNNQHPKIRMNLDAESFGEQPVSNVIGMIPGTEKPNEYVLLSAHFDSWDGSSGATDNATGTIMMMEAMRILKQVLPHPKRTILVGHWSGEEMGLVGSSAYAEDHPEVVRGLQALFNQDNGTGRIVRLNAAGLPNAAAHLTEWVKKLPKELQDQVNYTGQPGSPSGGGSDDASFACYGAPAFGLGAAGWDYGNLTWHTDRDTYDKIVFDEFKANATLVAMLAYQASEDPTFITRERIDLNAAAPAGPPGGAGQGRPQGPRTWPACTPAPRSTKPRLK